jgi:hypothetical protein
VNWHSNPARSLSCLALLSATRAMPQSCVNNSSPCVTTLTNAATFEAGAVAPGELVSLFGTRLGPQRGVQPQATLQSPFPTQVANVEVTFDGTPAPPLWVQDAQINVVAPWSLTPGQTTEVCVSYNNANGNCLTSQVVQTAPAVFLVDGTYAAALDQDGSINSLNNPAARVLCDVQRDLRRTCTLPGGRGQPDKFPGWHIPLQWHDLCDLAIVTKPAFCALHPVIRTAEPDHRLHYSKTPYR